MIATGAIRMEGTGLQYAPVEFPAVADFQVVNALAEAAKADGQRSPYSVCPLQRLFMAQLDPDKYACKRGIKVKMARRA